MYSCLLHVCFPQANLFTKWLPLSFSLQNHENQQIYNRALKVLEQYFGAEEEDEDSQGVAAPAQAVSGTGFNQYTFGQGGGQGGPSAPSSSGAQGGFRFG